MFFVCVACSSHLPPEFWLQGPDQGPERQKQMEAGQQNMDEKTQWNKSLMGLRAAHVANQGDSNVPEPSFLPDLNLSCGQEGMGTVLIRASTANSLLC